MKTRNKVRWTLGAVFILTLIGVAISGSKLHKDNV